MIGRILGSKEGAPPWAGTGGGARQYVQDQYGMNPGEFMRAWRGGQQFEGVPEWGSWRGQNRGAPGPRQGGPPGRPGWQGRPDRPGPPIAPGPPGGGPLGGFLEDRGNPQNPLKRLDHQMTRGPLWGGR